jgi:charged multivesicular body protein 5
MNRVFGKKKKAAPAPTLDDAASGLNGRIDGMDVKIAGLESELRVYKDKIKKAKSPAAKQTLQKRAMEILKRKKMYEQQRDTTAGQGKNNNSNNTETFVIPLANCGFAAFFFSSLGH